MMVMRVERSRIAGAAILAMIAVAVACSSDNCECPCGRKWEPVQYPPSNAGKVTITQGIWGDVWFWQGDFMPSCATGTVTAVVREMRIHELTGWGQVDHVPYRSTLFTAIHTPLVATVYSDEAGFFQVELPPGWYSLLAVEDTLFYSPGGDGVGNIYPVLVKEGQVTDAHFNITYMSAY